MDAVSTSVVVGLHVLMTVCFKISRAYWAYDKNNPYEVRVIKIPKNWCSAPRLIIANSRDNMAIIDFKKPESDAVRTISSTYKS